MNTSFRVSSRRVRLGIFSAAIALGVSLLAGNGAAQTPPPTPTPNDFIYGPLSSLPTNFDRIYAFRRASGQSDVLAASVPGTGTTLQEVRFAFVDGPYIYVSDFSRQAIFRIERATGNRVVFIPGLVRVDVLRAWRGQGLKGFVYSQVDSTTSTRLFLYVEGVGTIPAGTYPDARDVATDLNGKIYIASTQVNTIYTFDPFATTGAFGQLTTSGVALNAPSALAFYNPQTLLVANIVSSSIDAISLGAGGTGTVTRVSGPGRGAGAPFQTIFDVKVDGLGGVFVLASPTSGNNHLFIQIDMATGDRSQVGTTNGPSSGNFSIYDRNASDAQLIITQTGPGQFNLEAKVPPQHLFRILASTNLATDTFGDITGFNVSLRESNSFPITTALPMAFFRLEVLP